MSGESDIIRGRIARLDKANLTKGTQVGHWCVIANANRSSVGGPIDIATLEIWSTEDEATARASGLTSSRQWGDSSIGGYASSGLPTPRSAPRAYMYMYM